MKLPINEDLPLIIEEIKAHGSDMLISAQAPDDKFYLCNKEPLIPQFSKALKDKFPGLDEDENEKICEAFCIILESALIEIKFFQDKGDRDTFIQKALSDMSRVAITKSITRSTNIRNLYFSIESFLPGEFDDFVNTVKRLYSLQLKSKNYTARIENAENVRELANKFCLGIIGKYPVM
ncbi:MAG: hypothetical protein ABIO57_00140 [Candidatus Paceibacterota bacterium]